MQAGNPWDARVGDEVTVESHRLRGSRRSGVILEVLGAPESPYYRVRWQDGRETVFHPGSDAALHPKGKRRGAAAARPSTKRAAAKPPPVPKPPPAPKPAPATPRRPARLRASAGDRLVVKGHHLGAPSRDAEILEVLGEDGGPPFRVRWSDTGREGVLFPGPDAGVEHFRRRKRRDRPASG